MALYAITRDEDGEIALLALVCRIVEGSVTTVFGTAMTLGVLSLAAAEANAPDAGAYPLAGFLFEVRRWLPVIAAFFFSVGSTLFCWLLLRGRMIPILLAWLGLAASVLLVVCLPLQLVGVLHGSVTQLVWIPMAAFEIPLAVWLLVRGVAPLRTR